MIYSLFISSHYIKYFVFLYIFLINSDLLSHNLSTESKYNLRAFPANLESGIFYVVPYNAPISPPSLYLDGLALIYKLIINILL